MWNASPRAQDRLNDYWNALDRQASPHELARLRAQINPELSATIDSAIALHRRRRPDPAFGDRLEGELMNAFAISHGGTMALPHVQAPPSNGQREPWTPTRWLPTVGDARANRRSLAVQLGLVAVLLLTLIGGFFVYSSQSDHPAVIQQGTPVSTPTQDWTNTRGDAGRTGLGESGPVGQPVTIWTYQAVGGCEASPVAVSDTVFVTCGIGSLIALDRATGEKLWEFTAQSALGGMAVHSGTVLTMDVDGRLYGIEVTTGSQTWVNDGPYSAAPVAADGLVVIGAADGSVAAVDVATGVERWRTEVDPGGAARNPAIADGTVFAGSASNGFTALDLETGALIWQAGTNGQPTGTAVVANGVAYIGSTPDVPEGFLMAFDAKTGELRWQSDQPYFTPAVQDGIGFSGSVEGQVTALDLADGSERWQTTVGGVARPPVVAGEVVYVNSDGDQAIYAFDTLTGDELWRFPVQGALDDSPALRDGVLYAATSQGIVYAIGGADAIPAPGMTSATPEATAATVESATPAAVTLSPEVLWSTTGGDGGLSQPGQIAIAPDGNIWVADNDHHRFQIFTPDGTFIESWGTKGNGDGQFELRRSNGDGYGNVAFAPDGSFYVLDPGNFRIQKFDANRNFEAAWGSFGSEPGQFMNPVGLGLDTAGTLWVIDDGRGVAQHFDTDGTLLGSFPTVDADGHSLPMNGVTIGPDGLIHVSVWDRLPASNQIVVFQPDGTLARSVGLGEFDGPPGQLAFDADGGMLAVDLGAFDVQPSGRVLVVDSSGNVVSRIPIGGVPYGILIEREGDIYTTDLEGNTLTKYGNPLESSASAADLELAWSTTGGDTELSQPGRVTIAPDGNVWVADNDHHRFQILGPDGTFIETWGTKGSGDGQFELRRSNGDGYGNVAFAPDGSFFVLDPGNFRVQKFDAGRQFVSSFGGFGQGDGQFVDPVGLAVDQQGDVWVLDSGRHDIQRFDSDGTLLGGFAATDATGVATDSNGLGIAPDGTVYVTDCGPSCNTFRLLHYTADGELLGVIEASEGDAWAGNQPVSVTFTKDGRLFVTSLHPERPDGNVIVFDAGGQLVAHWQIGGYPYGIAVGHDGVYISQWVDGTVGNYWLPAQNATPSASTG